MSESVPLTRVVRWAQQLTGEVLAPGDLAVDLTAGSGRDTLSLFHRVGPEGRILAFDVQSDALRQTAQLLAGAGAAVDFWAYPPPVGPVSTGVHLIHDSHAHLDRYLVEPPRAIIANLGYLPGSDRTVATAAESSKAALRRALNLLAPGGRLAVALYVGHPGGSEEAEAVDHLFCSLAPERWDVLRLQVANREASPYLMAAGKRR